MNPEQKCPRCGQPLPPDAPAGRCPKCLVELALEAAAAETSFPTMVGVSRPATVQPSPAANVRVQYFGDYELVEEIARGGMGVVWKARQVSLNRPVALKMILAGKFASDADVRRFHTEAEAAANLQHPNIVAIHEVGEHEGQHYFSMDYVEGKNLAELVRDGPLAAAKAATLVKTIAEAIHYAHQRGTLHRDLKPSNVLMDTSGQPRITDFGLAKRFGVPPSGGSGGGIPAEAGTPSELTQTGAVMGSPSYMSPEQAAAKHDLVGPSSDVYSIGAMLYHVLTGRAPFMAETTVATLRKVMEEEPPAPSKINPKTPPDLETICLKCLEKRTERRYHSARELAEELDRFLNEEPILARPPSRARKAWSWSVRNPWALTGAASLLVLGLIGLAYGLWEQNRFLVWSRTHARPPRMADSALWSIGVFILGVAFWAGPISFGCLVDRKRRGLPILSRHYWIYGSSGVLEVAAAIGLALCGIHAYVWKTDADFQSASSFSLLLVCLVFPMAWFGSLLLWHLVRHFQHAAFAREGPEQRTLFAPPEQKKYPQSLWTLHGVHLSKADAPEMGVPRAFWTVAQRQRLNQFLAAFLFIVMSGMLCWPNLAGLVAILAIPAAAIPLFWAAFRKTKSANKYSILFLGFICFLFLLGPFLKGTEKNVEKLVAAQQASLFALGLGLACGCVLVRINRRQDENEDDLQHIEQADLTWIKSHITQILGAIMWVFLLVMLASWWIFPPKDKNLGLVCLTFVCFFQPYGAACWLRAEGAERRARGWTLGLSLTTAALFLVSNPLEYGVKYGLIGLGIGLLALMIVSLRSRSLSGDDDRSCNGVER